MTSQNVKSYLMQYRESLDRTREITQHLDELKSEAVRLKDHEGKSIALDKAVEKYMDACTAASVKLADLARIRGEIALAIDAVPDEKLRTLLRWRYICGESWERVAVEMNYTYRRITQLHGVALKAFQAVHDAKHG